MRKIERIQKQCETCSKDIFVTPLRVSLGRGKFCSHSCKATKNIAGWNKGQDAPWAKGHPQTEETRKKISMIQQGVTKIEDWKGYKGTENYLERRKFQQTMQKQIFERDNYTCQMCGSKKDLQVDHIQKWSDFEELRFDPENCRTLCAKCHYLITFKKPMPDNISGWGHNFLKGRVLT